jgi:uncharacterized Tic20 family protein
MSSTNGFRQFLLATGRPIAPDVDARPRLREALDTAILGSLSSLVGIVVLIVAIRGIIGKPVPDWHTEKLIYSKTFINYLEPSPMCAIAAVLGELMGLAGIALAWSRGRTISLLSALGTTLCLSHIFIFFYHWISISIGN